MGLRPCNDVTGRCWSGNRTRDTRFMRPMLYPTELSSGGRTGFEPVANGFRRCSASELPSARGTPSSDPRHTPRQRRAHRTGFRTRAAVDRSTMFRIGASSKTPIRVRVHPPAARAEASRHSASMRFRGHPCLGPACPDASGTRCNRDKPWKFPLRTAKAKRPRVVTRGRSRLPREIGGDRSPRAKVSRVG